MYTSEKTVVLYILNRKKVYKMKYESPELKISAFDNEDVITSSQNMDENEWA